MSINLASAILRGKWLIDPHYALTQGAVVASILNKQISIDKQGPDPLSAFAIDASKPVHGVRHSYYHGFDKAPQNSIAVISLSGALMKKDQYCGPSGMASVGRIIKDADAHHNIDGTVLYIDSPGGTVDGTEVLANIIQNAEKPVVTFVDGLMASAALWIGSSADHIMASTDTDEIGSVGVLMSFMDVQPFYEKQGVKFHTITASTSPDKTKMWDELCEGKYDNYVKDVLDPLDQKFMNVIRQNRPNVTDEHLSGKVFFAKDVLGILVDSVGSLEDAILKASELATANSNPGSNSNSKSYSMQQKTKLNAVLGIDALESVEDSVSMNEEQLELIEGALENAENVNAQLQTANNDLATANTAKETAETALATANSAFDGIDDSIKDAETAEEKVNAIRSLLAAKPGTTAQGTKTDVDQDADPDANWEAINNLPHNANID